ncbi:MAG TPA: 3-oxoadipate enol-lactonase [Gaiellaceae bacterium]|nr:3-oxoadipate enol-lactonase [Gaiellaceae bacterium]
MKVASLVEGPADAPAVIFGNSLGTTLELWDPQAAALRATHRVVRFDHRGHGRTPGTDRVDVADRAGDVLELADELGLDRFSFVGLSLGGAVGQWLGANAPERLDRLVLASTAVRFPNAATYLDRAAFVRREGLAPVVEAGLGRWFTPRADPAVVDRFRTMLLGIDPEGYAAGCEAVARWDFRSAASRIAAPALAVAGRDDPTTTPEVVREVADAVPGARLVVLDGAHLCSAESPDAFTEALLAHLDGKETAP